jgi:hypothetical protein
MTTWGNIPYRMIIRVTSVIQWEDTEYGKSDID